MGSNQCVVGSVSAHIRRQRPINFYDLPTGVLFGFGQTGGLFKLASYFFHGNQPLAYFANYNKFDIL